MDRTVTYSYTGQCPFTNDEQTVEVEYFEIPVVQRLKPAYKRKGLYCPVYSDYPCMNKPQHCPMFNNAPEPPTNS